MNLVIVAGTPGAGKTAVLLHAVKCIKEQHINVSIAKIDCLYTEDHLRFQKLGIPTMFGLSKDMCPDHFTIYNLTEMTAFAQENGSDMLIYRNCRALSPLCSLYCFESGRLCY
jgi:Ni2+-binding GTPase involved in maturation of urease and hydrogenase